MTIEELQIADHLISQKWAYDHHGIYIGGGRVVQYSGVGESSHGIIEEVSLSRFSNGGNFIIQDRIYRAIMNSCRPGSPPPFTDDEVVARARSRVGERAYDLLRNNCEHFVNWCLYDFEYSCQVENSHEIPVRIVLKPVIEGLSVVAGALGFVYDIIGGRTRDTSRFLSKDEVKAADMIKEIETHILLLLAELEELRGSVKIDFCHDFLLINRNASQPVSRGNADADATIIALPDDLLLILQGKLDPTIAFVTGKFAVEGSTAVATQFLTISAQSRMITKAVSPQPYTR